MVKPAVATLVILVAGTVPGCSTSEPPTSGAGALGGPKQQKVIEGKKPSVDFKVQQDGVLKKSGAPEYEDIKFKSPLAGEEGKKDIKEWQPAGQKVQPKPLEMPKVEMPKVEMKHGATPTTAPSAADAK